MLTGLAPWLLAAALVALVLVPGAMLALAWQRRCPTCRGPMRQLDDPDGPPTYDVLHCARCATAVTLVQGTRRRFAFCPRCRQRTLEARGTLLEGVPLSIEVKERCHLCNYANARVLRDGRGVVIPFPQRRGRAS